MYNSSKRIGVKNYEDFKREIIEPVHGTLGKR
jgi:hypothetical protein